MAWYDSGCYHNGQFHVNNCFNLLNATMLYRLGSVMCASGLGEKSALLPLHFILSLWCPHGTVIQSQSCIIILPPIIPNRYHIGIYFIGPISPASHQGSSYILTISDYFTKFVTAVPLPNKLASGVADALFKVGYNKEGGVCNLIIT